jgi:hypothetical protein
MLETPSNSMIYSSVQTFSDRWRGETQISSNIDLPRTFSTFKPCHDVLQTNWIIYKIDFKNNPATVYTVVKNQHTHVEGKKLRKIGKT